MWGGGRGTDQQPRPHLYMWIKKDVKVPTFFRGGASLETPGSEDPSVCLSELACEDDICTPPLLHAFVHFFA